MSLDANLTHNSQPSGRDDLGNPTWLGQNLPAILHAARDAAVQADTAAGDDSHEHLDRLLATLSAFTASTSGMVYQATNRLVACAACGDALDDDNCDRSDDHQCPTPLTKPKMGDRARCAWPMGPGGDGVCGLEIVYVLACDLWFHSGNTPGAAEAGMDHRATFAGVRDV